jgi:hypothetical protein
MKAVERIVTVASWEPRFLLGLERALERYEVSRVLVYYVKEYEERTRSGRRQLGDLAANRALELSVREIAYGSPSRTWRMIEEDLGSARSRDAGVLLDLTTMPRDVLWTALYWLESSSALVRYIYHRPEAYGSGWLARDPVDPRLLYKLSGELEFGRPTALVAVTGFDLDRCRQAVDFFEPARVVLATQTGRQFENVRRNCSEVLSASGVNPRRVDIDAYSSDHGYAALQEVAEELSEGHNVVLCSFGPKPSAIALYRLQRNHPQSALAFIGCRQYNKDYSEGLGSAIEGCLDWSSPS